MQINPVVDLNLNKFQIWLPLLQNIKPVRLIFCQSVQLYLNAIYQVSLHGPSAESVQMYGLTVLLGRTQAGGNDKIVNSVGNQTFTFSQHRAPS